MRQALENLKIWNALHGVIVSLTKKMKNKSTRVKQRWHLISSVLSRTYSLISPP
jgi:hypothetical protein